MAVARRSGAEDARCDCKTLPEHMWWTPDGRSGISVDCSQLKAALQEVYPTESRFLNVSPRFAGQYYGSHTYIKSRWVSVL